jgi:hypothetical protein
MGGVLPPLCCAASCLPNTYHSMRAPLDSRAILFSFASDEECQTIIQLNRLTVAAGAKFTTHAFSFSLSAVVFLTPLVPAASTFGKNISMKRLRGNFSLGVDPQFLFAVLLSNSTLAVPIVSDMRLLPGVYVTLSATNSVGTLIGALSANAPCGISSDRSNSIVSLTVGTFETVLSPLAAITLSRYCFSCLHVTVARYSSRFL